MSAHPTPAHFTPIRTRPIGVGQLRALDAVARHLNFRAAAQELSLTQSAVSRQVQALEDEVGAPLFLRHTRQVELTSAGAQLLRAVTPSLHSIDSAVSMVRRSAGRKTVAVTTWASFATMWLIPRLEAFQAEHPDIDIRIDATDSRVDLDNSDLDVALRYTRPHNATKDAIHLFGEQLTPVASPWLLKSGVPLLKGGDLTQHTLIEASDSSRSAGWSALSWRRWLDAQGLNALEPKRWLYFNYAHQIVQAALTGQGVALARMPLVADSLATGDLVEVLPGHRLDSPIDYYMLVAPRSSERPEIQAFCTWLLAQAQLTRAAMDESTPVGQRSTEQP